MRPRSLRRAASAGANAIVSTLLARPRRRAHRQRHSAPRRSRRPADVHARLRRRAPPTTCAPRSATAWKSGTSARTSASTRCSSRIWVGRPGRVVAFEPNPAARAVLTRNVALQLAAVARRDRPVGGRRGAGHRRLLHVRRRRHGSRRARPIPGCRETRPHRGAGHHARRVRRRARPHARPRDDGHRRLGDRGAAGRPLALGVRRASSSSSTPTPGSGRDTSRGDSKRFSTRLLDAFRSAARRDPLGEHGQVVLAEATRLSRPAAAVNVSRAGRRHDPSVSAAARFRGSMSGHLARVFLSKSGDLPCPAIPNGTPSSTRRARLTPSAARSSRASSRN